MSYEDPTVALYKDELDEKVLRRISDISFQVIENKTTRFAVRMGDGADIRLPFEFTRMAVNLGLIVVTDPDGSGRTTSYQVSITRIEA